jgi:ribokinase
MQHFCADDILILQNEINSLPKIIAKANEIGMSVVLNPSPFNEKILELDLNKIDWLILNETEGMEITQKTAPEEIISELTAAYPKLKIVLTLGKSGSIYAHKSERIHQNIFPAKAVDTTAAGDTFTGFFFSAYFKTQNPDYALKLASAASSITVSRMGAAPSIPTIDEIKNSQLLNIE